MCKLIKSLGLRNHDTAESSGGSVDRHQCTNCLYEQADLIIYTPQTSNIRARNLKYFTKDFRYMNADWYPRRLIKNAICLV